MPYTAVRLLYQRQGGSLWHTLSLPSNCTGRRTFMPLPTYLKGTYIYLYIFILLSLSLCCELTGKIDNEISMRFNFGAARLRHVCPHDQTRQSICCSKVDSDKICGARHISKGAKGTRLLRRCDTLIITLFLKIIRYKKKH